MPDLSQIIREAAARYNLSPEMMLRIAQLESGMNPNAANPSSSARGVYQFMTSPGGSWSEYGRGANPLDPNANVDAGMRYTLANMQHLKNQLGRDPTPAETYLAHQQGRSGATALLSAPNQSALSVLSRFHSPNVARQALTLNAGREDMTAGDFANLWKAKYEGTSVPTGAGAANVSAAAAPAANPNITNPAALTQPANSLGAMFSELLTKHAEPPQQAPPRKRPDARKIIGDLGKPLVLNIGA